MTFMAVMWHPAGDRVDTSTVEGVMAVPLRFSRPLDDNQSATRRVGGRAPGNVSREYPKPTIRYGLLTAVNNGQNGHSW
jgi:hypothetical protein